jgi:serine/threonine protein kinase
MDQHNLEAGIEIGDFRIERRLGAGGMGIVYKARQVSLDRTVALKILGAALSRESDRIRFQREAQAVAKLAHPGIAGVHFIGQDRLVCYMVMEYIDGISLRDVIDRLVASCDTALTIDAAVRERRAVENETEVVRFDQPTPAYSSDDAVNDKGEASSLGELTPHAKQLVGTPAYLKRSCEVAIEAADALAHAHERGVIHRDVKPENILIDRSGRVHLIDFGVARFFDDVTLTNTGALVGTPMYMSPEQVTGRLELDQRTDVYSLGLVLYELLTLARPIVAPTREGILRQILTKSMTPASWRNPALPRDLEGVVHKAIAKDADERYQTTLEFAADLKRWLGAKPVTAMPYRYRLDRREIKAERPGGIMVLAFFHFLVAVATSTLAIYMLGLLIVVSSESLTKSVPAPLIEDFTDEQSKLALAGTMVWISVITTYFLGVGFGFLSANRWARWLSIGVSSLVFVWNLYTLAAEVYFGRANAFLVFNIVVLAITGAIIAYLMRRKTRNWFQLAARVRHEHGRTAVLARRRVTPRS